MKKLNYYELCDTYEEIWNAVEKLKKEFGVELIIAFSGWGNWLNDYFWSENEDLKEKVSEFIDSKKREIIEWFIKRLRDYKVAILTGWTKWDVPKIAVEEANKYHIPTIWVLPERGKKYSLEEKLNLEIIISPIYQESQFGDESSIFSKLADAIIVLWGWAGTLIEIAHVLKINEARLKYWERIKYIVPIAGIPWLSERLNYIPMSKEIRDLVFPKIEIRHVTHAFDWLRKKILLDDFLKDDII